MKICEESPFRLLNKTFYPRLKFKQTIKFMQLYIFYNALQTNGNATVNFKRSTYG